MAQTPKQDGCDVTRVTTLDNQIKVIELMPAKRKNLPTVELIEEGKAAWRTFN